MWVPTPLLPGENRVFRAAKLMGRGRSGDRISLNHFLPPTPPAAADPGAAGAPAAPLETAPALCDATGDDTSAEGETTATSTVAAAGGSPCWAGFF